MNWEEQWDKLEEVFDQELWKLIESLIERGLTTEQATEVMAGFRNLTFDDDTSFGIVYEEFQEAEDKEDYKAQMRDLINIYEVEI